MLTIRAETLHHSVVFFITDIYWSKFAEYFLSLHILMINRVTNLPTVSSGYSELYCRSEASLKSGGAERSGERALQKNDGAERSAEREVAERERSGDCRNKLEHGAAFSPLTLRSHDPAGKAKHCVVHSVSA